MSDFLSAIETGARRSHEFKQARREIDQIIDDVSIAINKFTKGAMKLRKTNYKPGVSISRGSQSLDIKMTKEKTLHNNRLRMLNGLNAIIETATNNENAPNALVVVSSNRSNSQYKLLAGWSQDSTGYPCVVTAFGFEYICNDKSELTSAFISILKSPDFLSFIEINSRPNLGSRSFSFE
jgi:hypothetical protein